MAGGSDRPVEVAGPPVGNQIRIDPLNPSTAIDARPAAIINGRSVSFGDLRDALSEAAGGLVLEEEILDSQLRRALADAGQLITERDRNAERERLLETLSDDPDQAARLLAELRARRGLGPKRFDSLLFRTASLRRLVAPRVQVTEESIRIMYDIMYGERRQPRIMTFSNLADARRTYDELQRTGEFARLATQYSTDASAARGGLLEPIARQDASYPESLRAAMFEGSLGEVAGPILIDGRYVILRVDGIIPPTAPSMIEVRDELVAAVRLNQERLLMSQFARMLLKDASVTVFNESLNASWTKHTRRTEDLIAP
jgi:parvulin-like peptidyl-prolyl isomerase